MLVDRAIGLIALAIVVVFSLPWSYRLIGDEKGRLALVLVDLAAMSAGLGFLLLGHLPWPWLKTWWPTRHVYACSLVANQVIFNRQSGSQDRGPVTFRPRSDGGKHMVCRPFNFRARGF